MEPKVARAEPRTDVGRRSLLKTAAGAAVAAGFGVPAILRAQGNTIKIGHLAPRTGFLGPIGDYAVMGVTLAVDEVNQGGGILGRQVELIAEDSVNPATASAKAERLIERDRVNLLLGEISSASGLAIAQVAGRAKMLFLQTGCNSDELRGKACNRFMFHVEAANTMYVKTVGRALVRDRMVQGKRWMALTADYAFGHDLLRVTQRFLGENGGTFIGNELVPTEVTEFSPYILKVRQARPDLVVINLAGNQTTNFMKQYNEFNLPFPLAGGGFDTVMAWGAGRDSFSGIWPIVWHHNLQTPKSKAFTAAFVKRFGKPPENQAVGDYLGVKVMAQAMTETKSTDPVKLVEYLEKGAKFDVLRTREGYFRDWDHQMLFEMYTLTPKAKDKMADKWDMAEVSAPVPAANEALEVLAPTRQENPCSFA